MNNPNPFVPQGSLLEQQSKRRSAFKWGVLFVLTIGVVGLSAMLFQGCKREEENPAESENPPAMQTNDNTEATSNPAPTEGSNATTEAAPPVGAQPPAPGASATPPPPAPMVPAPAVPAPTESTYVVVKGDYMAKIAKENGVTLKALEDANPDVKPTRLHVGEKLVIPAGASTTGANAASETANGVAANGDEIYVVKAGDSLIRIAHHYGVTVKAIEAENNLSTTKIKVGQKLQIPAKPAAEPATQNAPPATTTAPESAPAATPSNPPAQPSAPPGQ
ncbi:MAG TPA: LysM peptidoglycan-binding domain-containing protein [Verrucomicrobiae bacterium]|nr:LysM peptidoglycan-binding domain-containing protein [Verrucomicrobiae bacterium]